MAGSPHDTSQDAGAVWEQMGTIDAAAIGRKTVRLGAAGHGGRMKLVVNVYPSFLVGAWRGARAGQPSGIDPAELGAVTEGGLLDAPLADAELHKIGADNFMRQFPLEWAVKMGGRLARGR